MADNTSTEQYRTLAEYLESTEKPSEKDDKVVFWQQRLLKAEAAKSAWFKDYEDCENILSNNLPLLRKTDANGNEEGITTQTDLMYKANPTIAALQWKESLLQKADTDIKLNAISGTSLSDKTTLEKLINWHFDYFNITRESVPAIREVCGFGFAVDYLGWNEMAKTERFKRGVPLPRSVDCRNFYVDHTSTKRNWADRRWSFERILLDIETAELQFPGIDFSPTAGNQTNGDPDDITDKVEIFLIQYKKTKRYNVVSTESEIIHDGQKIKQTKFAYLPEVQYATKDLPDDDETMDNITVSEEFPIEKEHWFQVYYSRDLQEMITEPEYIGDIDHYAIMHGFKIAGDIYPRSLVYLLKDEVDLKCLLLTKAMIDVATNGTPIFEYIEGALENPAEALASLQSMNPIIRIKAEWQEAHRDTPELRPYKFTFRTVDASFNLALSNLIDKYSQETWGNTPAMRGVSDFAGQSGVQTGMMQNAGMIITKSEELAYHDFLKKKAEIYLRYIVDYMDFEHTIPSMDSNYEMTSETVNKDNIVTWDYEDYFVQMLIVNDPEAIKAIKEKKYESWTAAGYMNPQDMMDLSGDENAAEHFKRGLDYRGLLEIEQAMQKSPELRPMIMQIIQQALTTAQPEAKVA